MGPELCVLVQGKGCVALFWVAEWRCGGILNDVQGVNSPKWQGKVRARGAHAKQRESPFGTAAGRERQGRGERAPSSRNRPSGQQRAGKDGERGERTPRSGNRPSGQQRAEKDGERGERTPSSGNRPSGQQLAGKDEGAGSARQAVGIALRDSSWQGKMGSARQEAGIVPRDSSWQGKMKGAGSARPSCTSFTRNDLNRDNDAQRTYYIHTNFRGFTPHAAIPELLYCDRYTAIAI